MMKIFKLLGDYGILIYKTQGETLHKTDTICEYDLTESGQK